MNILPKMKKRKERKPLEEFFVQPEGADTSPKSHNHPPVTRRFNKGDRIVYATVNFPMLQTGVVQEYNFFNQSILIGDIAGNPYINGFGTIRVLIEDLLYAHRTAEIYLGESGTCFPEGTNLSFETYPRNVFYTAGMKCEKTIRYHKRRTDKLILEEKLTNNLRRRLIILEDAMYIEVNSVMYRIERVNFFGEQTIFAAFNAYGGVIFPLGYFYNWREEFVPIVQDATTFHPSNLSNKDREDIEKSINHTILKYGVNKNLEIEDVRQVPYTEITKVWSVDPYKFEHSEYHQFDMENLSLIYQKQ